MKLLTTLAVASSLALSAGTARADNAGDLSGAFAVTQVATLGFGIYDVVATPRSKTYGVVELGAGLTSGVIAFGSVGTSSGGDNGERAARHALIALGIVDLAVAAHGVWLLARKEQAPAPIQVGSARGRVAPTVVSDGHTMAPAMGITGTF